MDTDIDIGTAAETPQEASQDGRTVKARPLTEQIAADEYLRKRKIAANPFRGIRVAKPVGNGAW